MSVPLDRLYHFIKDLSDCDLVIYRWYPHGSKNLQDLLPLEECCAECPTCIHRAFNPAVICHDQEPLDYDLYTLDDIFQASQKTKKKWREFMALDPTDLSFADSARKDKDSIKWFRKMHIRGLLSANVKPTILLHSEKNSTEVEKYKKNGYYPVYIWSHAIIAQDWFRYAAHDPRLKSQTLNYQYDFLIHNRAWQNMREYRLTFAKMIAKQGLEKHCLTKFSFYDSGTYYKEYKFRNPRLDIDHVELESKFYPNTTLSIASADYSTDDYCSSAIEIVLETIFDDSRWHLTEKTCRPLACGKPFILVSTMGSLKFLKSYGFKTWEGLIDESYDNIADPLDRLTAIIKEMTRICNIPVDQKKQFWKSLNDIATYNQQLFFSEKFFESVINEFLLDMQKTIPLVNSNIDLSLLERELTSRVATRYEKHKQHLQNIINYIKNFNN